MIDELAMLEQLGLNKFVEPSSLVDAVIDERENPRKGIAAPWSKLHGLFEIPTQGVTLFGGYSGHQKSTCANQWALHAAAQGHVVTIASLELTTPTLFEMLAGQSACLDKPHEDYLRRFGEWLDGKLHIVDHHDVMSVDQMITLIRDSKRFFGTDLFVLDCLFQVDIGGELENEKRFMQQLAVTARDYEMAIMVVHHARKPQGPTGEKVPPGKESFIGSSHIANSASAICVLHEDKEKSARRNNGEEVDDDFGDFTLSILKSRFMPWEGRISLFKHERARLLCNSRHRMYQPVDLTMEDKKCQSEENGTTKSVSEEALSTSLMRRTPESTHGSEQTIQKTGTEYLSWM